MSYSDATANGRCALMARNNAAARAPRVDASFLVPGVLFT
jgi:hypothetical protein